MKKLYLLSALSAALFSTTANAQAEPFLGQISFVAFNFAPQGWMDCNGQLLPINQNQALFSLLGTQYGGDGMSTFALPDMRGRSVIDDGTGPGLSSYSVGNMGGAEQVTLLSSQMPMHTHTINAVKSEGDQSSPTGNLPANTKALDKEYSSAAPDTAMKANMVGTAGSNLPHENRSPYLTLKCIIAVQGIYPSRP